MAASRILGVSKGTALTIVRLSRAPIGGPRTYTLINALTRVLQDVNSKQLRERAVINLSIHLTTDVILPIPPTANSLTQDDTLLLSLYRVIQVLIDAGAVVRIS